MDQQWLTSLKQFPIERLRFEHEKRQREIAHLDMEISRLADLEDQIYQDVLRGHGGAEQGARVSSQQFQLRQRIGELEGEMKAIEQVLESKWR